MAFEPHIAGRTISQSDIARYRCGGCRPMAPRHQRLTHLAWGPSSSTSQPSPITQPTLTVYHRSGVAPDGHPAISEENALCKRLFVLKIPLSSENVILTPMHERSIGLCFLSLFAQLPEHSDF